MKRCRKHHWITKKVMFENEICTKPGAINWYFAPMRIMVCAKCKKVKNA